MKKFGLLFLFGVALVAQQRNTVYLQLATGLTSISSTSYQVTNNVGQNFHYFNVVERPVVNSGASCAADTNYIPFTIAASIQASYDGSNYFQIPFLRVGFNGQYATNSIAKLYRVAGAYPYIQFKFLSFPTSIHTNCVIDLNYTGSLEGPNISDANTPPIYLGNQLGAAAIPYNSCTLITNGITIAGYSNSSLLIQLVGATYNPLGTNTTMTLYYGSSCTNGNQLVILPAIAGNQVSAPPSSVSAEALSSLGNIPLAASSALNVSAIITGTGSTGGYALLTYVIAN